MEKREYKGNGISTPKRRKKITENNKSNLKNNN